MANVLFALRDFSFSTVNSALFALDILTDWDASNNQKDLLLNQTLLNLLSYISTYITFSLTMILQWTENEFFRRWKWVYSNFHFSSRFKRSANEFRFLKLNEHSSCRKFSSVKVRRMIDAHRALDKYLQPEPSSPQPQLKPCVSHLNSLKTA